MTDDSKWFAPRRFGIGTGLPISWQGWGLTLVYCGAVVAVALKWSDKPVVMVAALAPITIIFMVIAAWKTRGGWRWRWGEDE